MDPSGSYDTSWAVPYYALGDFGRGYSYGVQEAAGTADAASPGYDNYDVFESGRHRGSSDFASGNVVGADDLRADPDAEWSREQAEAQQQERDKEIQEETSDENQLVMWPDGSVMTKREHLAKEISEHEGSPEMPEPVELGGD
jgi:hypothetical protein